MVNESPHEKAKPHILLESELRKLLAGLGVDLRSSCKLQVLRVEHGDTKQTLDCLFTVAVLERLRHV